MRPLLGEFLAQADAHIDAATQFDEPLQAEVAHSAVRELGRLLTAMARSADAFTRHDHIGPAHLLDAPARAELDARIAMRRAAVRMRVAERALGTNDDSHGQALPAVNHLAAAADCLAAGHDLLQTHFSPGWTGSRQGNSPWAPVIASAPVNQALLTQMAGYARRLAPWAIRLTMAQPPDVTLPPTARVAVSTACQWLRIAEAATWAASHYHHGSADGHTLLRAIPANSRPPRRPATTGGITFTLCAGAVATAERLQHLARAFTDRPHLPGTVTAASWQRTAQGAAITGHCSELILRSLAEPASQLTATPPAMAALTQAADATRRAWNGWRDVVHSWDTFTTGTSTKLTPAAAEIGDLVLWVGRLAHRDPAWVPTRGQAGLLREPSDLGGDLETITTVMTALHYVADALAHITSCERESVRSAVAGHELFVPTRMLPEDQDVPYRYALAPAVVTDSLLDSYDAAIKASHAAVTAFDQLASAVNSVPVVLTALRAADGHRMPYLPRHEIAPFWPSASQPRPGEVERALRDREISEPALLAHASDLDAAANELIKEAITRTRRRPPTAEMKSVGCGRRPSGSPE